jgi:hypothetical protein
MRHVLSQLVTACFLTYCLFQDAAANSANAASPVQVSRDGACDPTLCKVLFGVTPALGSALTALSCSGHITGTGPGSTGIAWIAVGVANGNYYLAPQVTAQVGNSTWFVANGTTTFMLNTGGEFEVDAAFSGAPTNQAFSCTVLLSSGSRVSTATQPKKRS